MRRPALSARDRRAMRVGLWVLAPALAFGLVLRPYARALERARTELVTQRGLLARELGALRDAPRDARRLREGRRALAAESQRLLDGADAVAASASLAGYVSDRADEAGLAVEESETRAASAGDDVPPTVQLRAVGDVLAVVAFLRALEDGPVLARVEHLTIASESGPDDATLTLTAAVTGLARRAFADSSAGRR